MKRQNQCCYIYKNATAFWAFSFSIFENKNTKNDFLLFSKMDLILKMFFVKIFLDVQPNIFSGPFSVFSENENRKCPTKQGLKFLKQYIIQYINILIP